MLVIHDWNWRIGPFLQRLSSADRLPRYGHDEGGLDCVIVLGEGDACHGRVVPQSRRGALGATGKQLKAPIERQHHRVIPDRRFHRKPGARADGAELATETKTNRLRADTC